MFDLMELGYESYGRTHYFDVSRDRTQTYLNPNAKSLCGRTLNAFKLHSVGNGLLCGTCDRIERSRA